MKKEGRSIQDIMEGYSPERQKRIREMVAKDKEEYRSLKAFRKALGMTQTEVADNQAKKQVNIAQLEDRPDIKLQP